MGDETKPKYKLVVSDFHLGKGRHFRDKTQNILEDFIYDREFAEFLDYHCAGAFQEAEVELILNGDVLNLLQMDSWGVHTHLITEQSVVRSVEKIINGHPVFFRALQRFAATPGHSIAYITGNHDVGMLWPKARAAFAKAVGAPVTFHDVHYLFDGVYVEHGHQHERFAAIDMQKPFIRRLLPEPVLNLPWGSTFVAVFLPGIKQERPYIDKVRPFPYFLRWVMIHDTWWGMKTLAKVLAFTLKVSSLQRRFRLYQNLWWTIGLMKEMSFYPDFDKVAFGVLRERDDIHTVIFGHTHLLRYRQWREGKEYFNIGTWNEMTNLHLDDYGKRIRLSYAFIEYPAPQPGSPAPRPKTRLKEWLGRWKPEVEVLA